MVEARWAGGTSYCWPAGWVGTSWLAGRSTSLSCAASLASTACCKLETMVAALETGAKAEVVTTRREEGEMGSGARGIWVTSWLATDLGDTGTGIRVTLIGRFCTSTGWAFLTLSGGKDPDSPWTMVFWLSETMGKLKVRRGIGRYSHTGEGWGVGTE